MPDDLTAALNRIGALRTSGASDDDTRRLLAAVEAVLKLADDWKREAARLEPSGADAVQPAMPGNYLVSGRIGAFEDCVEDLREAITRELTRKVPDNE